MKIRLCFFVSILFLSCLSSTAQAADFPDVSQYKEEIKYLSEQGIITGYEDGTFKPEKELLRVHAVMMLLREMGITDFNAPNPGFTDMQPGDYGYPEVAKAVQLGFIDGKSASDGSKYFDAAGSLTRAQMAKIMTEGYTLMENQRISFIDVPLTHWANPYINRLATANITSGFPDSTFKPSQKLSRQHFSVFMARLLNDEFKVKTQETSFLPDRSNEYVYAVGDSTSTFTHLQSDQWEEDVRYSNGGGFKATRTFSEKDNGIVYGEGELVFNFTLGYPVKTGHQWIDQNGELFTITATDATIQTPAGTFTNAVIVSNANYLDYYVPNIGIVKSTYRPTGLIIAELIEIKK
ncbi:S-layer homology domain-containing protein [Rossellomorea aquimaris]|uniref:S-layer homology domain-containing protein n=1 Tax=Rossellomorea aquimaris TaxID=189382 RepID=UPI001CFE7282|nr:S-layer homology domain-containing protein [Rossellomorea aquimaris]